MSKDWDIYKLKLKAYLIAFAGFSIGFLIMMYGFIKFKFIMVFIGVLLMIVMGVYSKFIMFKYKRRSGYIIHQE